jgi:signal transduction histidine kinase
MRYSGRYILFVGASLVLLVLGLIGLWRIRYRPGAGFKWKSQNSYIVLYQIDNASLKPGDILIAINDQDVQSVDHVEFLLDQLYSGDTVRLRIQRDDSIIDIATALTSRFSQFFCRINLILGLCFWIVGVFVYAAKQQEQAARIFAWMSVISGTAILMIWPGRPYGNDWLGFVLPAVYFILYPLIPPSILYFAAVYPEKNKLLVQFPFLRVLLFIPALILIGLLETGYFRAILQSNAERYILFYAVFRWLHLLFIVYFVLSIICLVRSYTHAGSLAHRNKVQWILWGTALGMLPFIFLWLLPGVFGLNRLIPNEVGYLAMMLIPLAVAFSIVRYHALNIEIVVNRSLVYSIITGFIILLYLLITVIIAHSPHMISHRATHTISILFTLFVVIIFIPVKNRIQLFVDKTFYRIKYNYKMAVQTLSQALITVPDEKSAIQLVLNKMRVEIPTSFILIMDWDSAGRNFIPVGYHGEPFIDIQKFRLPVTHPMIRQIRSYGKPLVRKGRLKSTGTDSLPEETWAEIPHCELVIPLLIQGNLEGIALFGQKLSGASYTLDDLDLLTQMLTEGLMVLDRIRLQTAVIIEKTEKEKHESLSRLKSEFVSHVSHELRTPLTSIEWSIQNLLDGIPEKPSPKVNQYLFGIYESSQHLKRMIENLLNISAIEAGKVEIVFESFPLDDEIRKAIQSLKPLAERKNIKIVLHEGGGHVHADRDCTLAICTNLIENAIKYSPAGKIIVQTQAEGNDTIVSVIDQGIGIPAEKQKMIFDRFERVKMEKGSRERGLGLGLYIAKMLVEAQGGAIWVESEEGKGSTFNFTLLKGK